MREKTKDLVGVDGCKGGWYAVRQHARTGAIETRICASFAGLLAWAPAPAIVAVDMPIGLASTGYRACDAEARQRLKWPRSASVFQTPVRQTLGIREYRTACDLNREATGKGISQQAFNILGKIAEVDTSLRASKSDASRVFEVHPELAFMQLQIEQGGEAAGLKEGKTSEAGHAKRKALLDPIFGATLQTALDERVARHAQKDDVLDAFAVLWSARRIEADSAVMLPDDEPRDGALLPMVIRY
jgi:predicted RNase H-like nuclease